MGRVGWVNGKCANGHDVSTPDKIVRLSDGSRRCLECRRESDRRRYQKIRDSYEPRVCQYCGNTFKHDGNHDGKSAWTRRKYCSIECRRKNDREKDLNGRKARRKAHKQGNHELCSPAYCDQKIPNPLPPYEVARLRAMVNFDPVRDGDLPGPLPTKEVERLRALVGFTPERDSE